MSTGHVTFLNTVQENEALYTKQQVAKAKGVMELYVTVGCPSWRDFEFLIRTNQIKNYPFVQGDVKVAKHIYGDSVTAMKGKMVRKTPPEPRSDLLSIPPELIKAHQGIELCADIFYIEEVPFLLTVSKKLKFMTARVLNSEDQDELGEALDATFRQYNKAGFDIKTLYTDRQFECLWDVMTDIDITLDTAAAQAHQADVERMIRLVKERFRSIFHSLPFGCWPRVMIVRGVYWAMRWLNAFPPKGESPKHSALGRSSRPDRWITTSTAKSHLEPTCRRAHTPLRPTHRLSEPRMEFLSERWTMTRVAMRS